MYNASLILEGGGMRGIFTAGVLDYFLEQGLEFEAAYGVSAGACHACSFLSKQFGRAYHAAADFMDDKRYCSFHSLRTTGDLFGVDFVYRQIPDELLPYDHDTFAQSQTEFYAVVTNCLTGDAEYMRISDLHRDIIAVQASASLPLLSRIVDIGGTPYLDGGVADSIPLRASQDMGHEKNVVILTQPVGYRKGPNKMMPLIRRRYQRYPALVEAMAVRHLQYNADLAYLEAEEKAGNVFLLRPMVPLNLGRIEKDKKKLEIAYQLGYVEAKKQYKALISYLENEKKS